MTDWHSGNHLDFIREALALRKDGVPTDDIIEQCRWASSEMMSRYDTRKDQRRDAITARLDSLRLAALGDDANV